MWYACGSHTTVLGGAHVLLVWCLVSILSLHVFNMGFKEINTQAHLGSLDGKICFGELNATLPSGLS